MRRHHQRRAASVALLTEPQPPTSEHGRNHHWMPDRAKCVRARARVYVCVCVESERERERERLHSSQQFQWANSGGKKQAAALPTPASAPVATWILFIYLDHTSVDPMETRKGKTKRLALMTWETCKSIRCRSRIAGRRTMINYHFRWRPDHDDPDWK